MVLKPLLILMKDRNDDCDLIFVDRGWQRDPLDISDRIYVPPADWVVDSNGRREMYIPPAGWIPDPIDTRDCIYVPPTSVPDHTPTVSDILTISTAFAATTISTASATPTASAPPIFPRPASGVPESVDLRDGTDYCQPIFRQYPLGSCVANAIASAFIFTLKKEIARKKAIVRKKEIEDKLYKPIHDPQTDPFDPSRLFIWYHAREMFGLNRVKENRGCHLRDGLKSAFNVGVCPEEDLPYATHGDYDKVTRIFVENAPAATKPSDAAYAHALQHQVVRYERIRRNLNHLRSCLAEGFPFVFGFSLFESNRKKIHQGVVEMPRPREGRVSGHAVMAVGYDNAAKHFIIQNSWGANWNTNGYFTMPYKYIDRATATDDFWMVRLVNNYVQKPQS